LQSIDNYRILSVLHEGYSSVVCHAVNKETGQEVALRIFTPQSGVDEKIAARLTRELEILKKLPPDYFIRHLAIKRSRTGLWYRVSEWVDAENWSELFTSDHFSDYRNVFTLFQKIASILEGLHRTGHSIPHLILNDIIICKEETGALGVKIDYKVSRFLDPRLDRPGAMLKNLLKTHPDILHQRPLNRRSDIWSLGKTFIEILSGDLSGDIDYIKTIDQLAIPTKAKMLFKTMLSDDRDLRPADMTQVVQALSKISAKNIFRAQKKGAAGDMTGLKRWLGPTAVFLFLVGTIAVFSWLYSAYYKKEAPSLGEYANRYAGSVAFVMVDYQLLLDQRSVYRNRTEGTAFLVSPEGHMITNRHVACPWLEDKRMFQMITRLKHSGHSPRLDYHAYLWFEGQKAFKRLPEPVRGSDLEDFYHTKAAYRLSGSKKLSIAGVAHPPAKTWRLFLSPLKDDFAVLKVEPVPKDIIPLPLDDQLTAINIPKLTPVMTLGFPLGSRTQTDTVNVSVSTGHVRRTFKTMFQVDTSIYQGNSGGPVIDPRGRVVGIASSVYANRAQAPVPVITLLSDIGLVLPINKAATFLGEIQEGHPKWNGYLDLAIDNKLKRIHTAAEQGKWEKAQQLADSAFAKSNDLALALTAGLIHFCRNDYPGATSYLIRAISMQKDNDQARLLLYLIDYLTGQGEESLHRKALMALDWRAPAEFFGYVVKVLTEKIPITAAVNMGDTNLETGMLHYAAGLMLDQKDQPEEAKFHLQKALAKIGGGDQWLYLMALAKLETLLERQVNTQPHLPQQRIRQSDAIAAIQTVRKERAEKIKAYEQLTRLRAGLAQPSVPPAEKQAIVEKIQALDRGNVSLLLQSAYYYAMDEKWAKALTQVTQLLQSNGRESASRLAGGLLEPLLLNRLGRSVEAKNSLKAFQKRIQDPWYRQISACLLDLSTEVSLAKKADEQPAYLLTGYTALGLWAEGNSKTKRALRHYKEALGSYRDDRIEYRFAEERIRRIQQTASR